jgi:ribonuclease P/MRP protein subunit RPP1
MDFYDLHLHSEFSEGKSSVEDFARRAKTLGFKGICFAVYYKDRKQVDRLKKTAVETSKKIGIDIFIGLEATTLEELKKLINIRRDYDLLLVRGTDLNLNRKAVETKEVDILTHPEYNRKDSGLNHVMAKLAAKNQVAIEINFREILLSSKNTRSHIMRHIRENVKLCKKYKTSIIISSGAVSHWQLKDPKVLMSMGCLLGLELNEAKDALSKTPENMIKMIKERRDRRWIRPGVKVVG